MTGDAVTSPARDERTWTLRTGGDSLGRTNPDHFPGRHYHVVSVSPAITEDGDLVVIPLAAHEAALAAARQVDEAMVERAREAGAAWFAGHPDGASADEEWRDFHRAALLAALTVPELEEER